VGFLPLILTTLLLWFLNQFVSFIIKL
jgi:hypothetical protein